jgi:hypothetical protein
MSQIPLIENERPEVLRDALVDTGLFLVSYELIRALVVKPVEFFYDMGTFSPGMPFIDFKTDVLSRSKHKFDACLLWLRDHMKAISNEQYKSIHAVREFRDEIAHGIHEKIGSFNFTKSTVLLMEARKALFALDNFWVRMEIQVDPEFAHIKDWSSVYSNSFAMLDTLITVVRPID